MYTCLCALNGHTSGIRDVVQDTSLRSASWTTEQGLAPCVVLRQLASLATIVQHRTNVNFQNFFRFAKF